MNDCQFPLINYTSDDSFQNGLQHGEEFREAIKELVKIRKELMLAKNPRLKPKIEELALAQYQATIRLSIDLGKEVEGIAKGSGLNLSDIIVLNNYTDFRDIELPEEGCSTLHVQNGDKNFCGQTWDMHQSAKNFVCGIKIKNSQRETVLFSLVGCLGMMGATSAGTFIGVNNINTKNAKAGILWPALVRHCLNQNTLKEMRLELQKAPVTSGHNYIIASPEGGEMWEIGVGLQASSGRLAKGQTGVIFHTNHCLTEEGKCLEDELASNSTTHIRYELLEKKASQLNSLAGLEALLKDHENYPRSLCSHFESGAQDPSMTCGGGVFDPTARAFKMWRGCPTYDQNYRSYSFNLGQ